MEITEIETLLCSYLNTLHSNFTILKSTTNLDSESLIIIAVYGDSKFVLLTTTIRAG